MRKRKFTIKKSFIHKRLLLIYGAVFVLALFVIIFVLQSKPPQAKKTPPDPNIQIKKESLKLDEKLIAITDTGFEPKSLTIPGENKRALVFYNATSVPQTIESTYINFPSTTIQSKGEFSYRFDVIGLWIFTLKEQQNNKMSLIVQ